MIKEPKPPLPTTPFGGYAGGFAAATAYAHAAETPWVWVVLLIVILGAINTLAATYPRKDTP